MIGGQSAIDELRRGWTGEVLDPDSRGYDDARRSFNAMRKGHSADMSMERAF